MTPEEKAVELFNKMYNVDAYDDYGEAGMEYGHAKKCTLIAVDEIMKICPSVYLTYDKEVHSGHRQYWEQVKQEINNL